MIVVAEQPSSTESVLEPPYFNAVQERAANKIDGMIFQPPHGGEQVVCRGNNDDDHEGLDVPSTGEVVW